MKPVDQTRFGEDGNCFVACIASIFECAIAEVSLPLNKGQGWSMHLGEYLKARGLVYVEVPRGNLTASAQDDPPREAKIWGWQPLFFGNPWPVCILAGPSPRMPGMAHAVVGRSNGWGYEIVHDPHPDRAGLSDVDHIGFFVKVEPLD